MVNSSADVDVALIGAGLMGSAAAHSLTARGLSVAVFEQFEVGHKQGSSHGSARIVRRSYADPVYAAMTGRALELWRELEHQSGQQLLRMTGGLDHGPGHAERLLAVMQELGIPSELMTADQAHERWPGIVFDGQVLHHPDAGTVDAERAVRAALEVASRDGAVISTQTAVERIEQLGDQVRLTTPVGQTTARIAVIAAGAWAGELLDGLLTAPRLTVTQEQIFHFARRDPDAHWPTVVHLNAQAIYALPGGRDGGAGDAIKVAEHEAGTRTTARSRDGMVSTEARRRVTEYVERWFPGLVPEAFASTTCLYTSTDNEDFIIDRVGQLVVCSPCSGHGAKFAPVVGELVAGLVTGDEYPPARFSIAAHLLAQAGNAKGGHPGG